jgi:hypothetical protein
MKDRVWKTDSGRKIRKIDHQDDEKSGRLKKSLQAPLLRGLYFPSEGQGHLLR